VFTTKFGCEKTRVAVQISICRPKFVRCFFFQLRPLFWKAKCLLPSEIHARGHVRHLSLGRPERVDRLHHHPRALRKNSSAASLTTIFLGAAYGGEVRMSYHSSKRTQLISTVQYVAMCALLLLYEETGGRQNSQPDARAWLSKRPLLVEWILRSVRRNHSYASPPDIRKLRYF
jgi:hypothetical protein